MQQMVKILVPSPQGFSYTHLEYKNRAIGGKARSSGLRERFVTLLACRNAQFRCAEGLACDALEHSQASTMARDYL